MKDRGFTEPQAEAVIEAIRVSREADLQASATKADLRELELRLQAEMKDIVIKLGGMIVALGTILIAIKYFG